MLLLVNTASSEITSKTFQRPDILWLFGGGFIILSLFVDCSSTPRLIKILGLLCILMKWVQSQNYLHLGMVNSQPTSVFMINGKYSKTQRFQLRLLLALSRDQLVYRFLLELMLTHHTFLFCVTIALLAQKA